MSHFSDEFYRLTNLIENSQRLVFARYSGGEGLIMKKIPYVSFENVQIDKWAYHGGDCKLRDDMYAALRHVEHPEWIYGIPCSCCNDTLKHELIEWIGPGISADRLTYVNMWVNTNYPLFRQWIHDIKEPIVVIGNGVRANPTSLPFNVHEYVPIAEDCINWWESNRDNAKEFYNALGTKYNNTLFFVAAGPMSEPIIDFMWQGNPNNRYIDVGSALDEFLYGSKTRPYQDPATWLGARTCVF